MHEAVNVMVDSEDAEEVPEVGEQCWLQRKCHRVHRLRERVQAQWRTDNWEQ